MKQKTLTIIILLLLLAACRPDPAGSLHQSARSFLTSSPTPPPVTPQPNTAPTTSPLPIPVTPTVPPAVTSTMDPATPAGGGVNAFISPEEAAATRLADTLPPVRDDVLLAQTYLGIPAATSPAGPTYAVEATNTLTILNYQDNSTTQIEAVLLAAGEHAYFWFDTGTTAAQLSGAELAETVTAFDEIYDQVVAQFGALRDPGIDGDPRVHIVHAGPIALCGSSAGCGLAGYYSADNALPRTVNPNSNQRDMFVMNVDQFGTAGYLSVLAHEFRHLVEDQYNAREADWAVEGSAVLAEELAGWPDGAFTTGNGYLADPDLQLNRWSSTDTYRHYGQGYVLSRYLYEQLGPAGYLALATHPAGGLDALDELHAAGISDRTGVQLWRDWLVAMAIHNRPDTPPQYDLGEVQMDIAAMPAVETFPAHWETTVNQFGVDYYRLPAGAASTILFAGSTEVATVDTTPPSGRHVWVSGRENYSESRLTRAFDLRAVENATLEYAVYYDIEAGFDFAYLFVSNDNGTTWEPLAAPGMQDRRADPGRVALVDHFYSGRSANWLRESVDLTSYAGQEILIRFTYITDPVLTDQGLALDDIAVPEIGFFDDVEAGDNGWLAEGFVPVTTTIPQQWHLQLVFLGDGPPQVVTLPLEGDNSVSYPVPATADGAILIVAASAPFTLQPAGYSLTIGR